ncbi:MAG: thioredoxin family protein [Methanoregula sp.]
MAGEHPFTQEIPSAGDPAPATAAPAGTDTPPDPVIELDDRQWETIVEKGTMPVAVMFYSPTCTFCHQMEPSFRHFAREYHDAILFVRLNITTNLWTAERYGVRSTPTFKFFCGGKPVQELVGGVYPALLKKMIDDVILHGKECALNSTAIDYEITGYG